MQEKKFEVTYKSGIKRIFEAIEMYIEGGKVYQLTKHWTGYPLPSCFSAKNVISVKEVAYV